jgi:Bifunctional DNA primase/polymerase, N-terminal
MSQEKTGPELGNPGTGNDKRAASHRQHNEPADIGAYASTALTGHSRARNLHDRGLHVFPVDHPRHRECIGKHSATFPCDGTRGKHPAVKWGVWAVTVTPQMIEREWGRYRGLANIGVACGPSNLVVLDEDKAGEIERWCVTYGIALPDTYTVTTARGPHLYFRWDHTKQRIGNSPKAMEGFKIDVRGDGGFVVAEGSRHADGHLYIGNGHEIAALPDEVADLLLAGGHPEPAQPEPVWEVVEVVDYNTTKIGFHHRHNSLVAYAGRLRKSGLDRAEAEPTFRATSTRVTPRAPTSTAPTTPTTTSEPSNSRTASAPPTSATPTGYCTTPTVASATCTPGASGSSTAAVVGSSTKKTPWSPRPPNKWPRVSTS